VTPLKKQASKVGVSKVRPATGQKILLTPNELSMYTNQLKVA
jgi:hypothetical protein